MRHASNLGCRYFNKEISLVANIWLIIHSSVKKTIFCISPFWSVFCYIWLHMILALTFLLTLCFISRIFQLPVSMGILLFWLQQTKSWFHQNFYPARLFGHQTANLVLSPPIDQLQGTILMPFLRKLIFSTFLLTRIGLFRDCLSYFWLTTALLAVYLPWSKFDINVIWPHFCSITVSSLLCSDEKT